MSCDHWIIQPKEHLVFFEDHLGFLFLVTIIHKINHRSSKNHESHLQPIYLNSLFLQFLFKSSKILQKPAFKPIHKPSTNHLKACENHLKPIETQRFFHVTPRFLFSAQALLRSRDADAGACAASASALRELRRCCGSGARRGGRAMVIAKWDYNYILGNII